VYTCVSLAPPLRRKKKLTLTDRTQPGHGLRFIRKDGQPLVFSSSKAKRMYKQNIKPAKLTWTMAWRRLHKKDKKEEGSKGRKRRVVRTQRAIVGLSMEEMAKKNAAKPALRAAAKDNAMKEAQDR
jgi:large subunit ribosomal protein L24e